MGAVRAHRPGCSWCSNPIVSREVTGWRFAAQAPNTPYPPPCADVHEAQGGGQLCAVRHCTHSAVWHGAHGAAHCREQCRAAQRMWCTVVRGMVHTQCGAARHTLWSAAQSGAARRTRSSAAQHTRTWEPPPPPSRSDAPPPCPGHGGAATPPGPRARTGHALHAWPANMQGRRDSHRAPPKRPVSLKIGPQIKSNQIQADDTLTSFVGRGGASYRITPGRHTQLFKGARPPPPS